MTKLEALKELAAKVGAGDYNNDGVDAYGRFNEFCNDWERSVGAYTKGYNYTDAWNAYHGSRDAAKALHEDVLPGWVTWDKSHSYFGYEVSLTSGTLDSSGCSKVSEARALILAIIRALISQET